MQANNSKESQSTEESADTAKGSGSNNDSTCDSGDAPNKKPAKKIKRVSFSTKLEASDDAPVNKPDATFTPPVSIIKKECLTRAIQIARGGGSIIMPSRLTGVTQRFRHDIEKIDKLASLTFKSQFVKSSHSDDNDDDNTSDTDERSDEDSETRKKDGVADSSDSDDSMNGSQDGHNADDSETANLDTASSSGDTNNEAQVKRSVHSSRVIKPNKKFIDDVKTPAGKNGVARKKNGKTEAESIKASIDDADKKSKDGK